MTRSEIAKIFDILSNEVRLCTIINLTKNKELKVSDLQNCANSSQSFVSQQLSKLKDLKIVDCRKEGSEVYYSLIDNKIKKVIEDLDLINKIKG